MNANDPVILRASGLSENQEACVDLLEQALEQARAGNISSIAIVVCMKNGYAHVMAGSQAGDLNLGCDSLKAEIMRRVENAGAKPKGSLLKVRG